MNVQIVILLALEYLAESAPEVRYTLLRNAINCAPELNKLAIEQILSCFAPQTIRAGANAIDETQMKQKLLRLAKSYAQANDLKQLFTSDVASDAATDEAVKQELQRQSKIERCAAYARRAITATPAAKTQALEKLADELSALCLTTPLLS